MKTCIKCKKPAITFIRYNGTHLCRDHFVQYFERRVKKDIKKQGKTENKCRIGVAVSGGKDSTVALYVVSDIFSKRKNIDLVAITIDEGIQGYRDESIKFASGNCRRWGIEYHVVSFKYIIGRTIDNIASNNDDMVELRY